MMNEAQKRGYIPVRITKEGGWPVGTVVYFDPETTDMCWNGGCTRCWAHIPGDTCEYLDEVQMDTPEAEAPSLRDEIAMRALSGMLAHSRHGQGYRPRDPKQHWHVAISEEAYEIADAMLEARK